MNRRKFLLIKMMALLGFFSINLLQSAKSKDLATKDLFNQETLGQIQKEIHIYKKIIKNSTVEIKKINSQLIGHDIKKMNFVYLDNWAFSKFEAAIIYLS